MAKTENKVLTSWREVKRGRIVEETQNREVCMEGALRRKWISPEKGNEGWREGLVAGNGIQGLVSSCSPYDEALIYQSIRLIIPSFHPRKTPDEVTGQLEEAREAVFRQTDGDICQRDRTTVYSYHPGALLRIRGEEKKIGDYRRWTDYASGDLHMEYQDEDGLWSRRHFVSRSDDSVVTEYKASDRGKRVDREISFDLPEEMPGYGCWKFGVAPETEMKYAFFAEEKTGLIGMIAHYPEYEGSELATGGYMTICRLITYGGIRNLSYEDVRTCHMVSQKGRPVYEVRGAKEMVIFSQTDPLTALGRMDAFCDVVRQPDFWERPEIGEILLPFLEKTDRMLEKYQIDGHFSYDAAILEHAQWHTEHQSMQCLELPSDSEMQALSTEELLTCQKQSGYLINELFLRVYEQSRYAMLCCSGYSAPRLCGMWTGEWNPAWSGAYTMDANVNIQVSGMNLGNMREMADGYCRFVRRQMKDWKENAKKVYGMKDALLVPVNTDGSRAMMVEYDGDYPFQYWNAGASWMALPVFESWQCFGNRRIRDENGDWDLEEGLLKPLLSGMICFWLQFCTPEYFTDKNGAPCFQAGKQSLEEGEHYLLLPTYSPENHPAGQKSSLAMNASMDIAAARDSIRMLRKLEEVSPDREKEKILKECELLERGLPDYLMDDTGAMKEWALLRYRENNEHRHVSHLYCAWPAFETAKNPELIPACIRAVENRNRENDSKDDTASHGWIHRALIAVRLKKKEELSDILLRLFRSDLFYTTGMTDHNTDRCRAVFCTDTLFGLYGILQEMLLYSDSDTIEVLPALIPQWKKGKLSGARTRTGALVKELDWDMDRGRICLVLVPDRDQEPRICYGEDWKMELFSEQKLVNGQKMEAGKTYRYIWSR